ncbi:hypothetical protein EIP91_000033 [Steccherinum ochraceum]|uniref:ELYS-like domain-containing protein n=1 Tax=Steccherinum ochraceum TaxID=92696 RepID=A0A4R0RSQ3_9APHY|nr:hypothetical protein EIP91_000033 [Steccherinum ochraceum]
MDNDISSDMVDEEQVENVMSLFDTSETFAFRNPIPQQIQSRRTRMSDVLIFDILLTSGNVRNPSTLYPPQSVSGLRELLLAIEVSSYDSLKKDCLVYFLLKWQRDDKSRQFREARSIPPQFVALSDAYWSLDSGVDIPRAITQLADARLNRDYTTKILQAISLSQKPNPLILRYVRTAKPILSEPDDIDMYTIALADSNLLEAWQYQQTFPEGEIRTRLINKLLRWCFTPKPKPQAVKQLLGYPLTAYEQFIIHGLAIHPPTNLSPPSVTAIQDLVCLRLVLSGQTVAAVKLNRQFPVGATNESRRAAQDRKQLMLDEAVSLLPAAERRLLELDMERSNVNGDLSASGSEHWKSAVDLSMSMSWEHVPSPPTANGSAKTGRASDVFMQNPATPIPKKSGAPRFGGPISALAKSSTESPSFVLGRTPPTAQHTKTHPEATTSTSRVRSLAAKFQYTAPELSTSLYDTHGSANHQRNAFYEPPTSAGSKRPLAPELSSSKGLNASITSSRGGDLSTASATAVVRELMREEEEEEEDVEMNASEEQAAPEPVLAPAPDPVPSGLNQSQSNRSLMDMDEDEDPRELNFSLFASSIGPSTGSRPQQAPKRESASKILPGAFYATDDDDLEAGAPSSHAPPPPSMQPFASVHSTSSRSRKSEPKGKQPAEESISAGRRQSSRSQGEKPAPASKSRIPRKSTKSRVSAASLGRSLPGSLMDDDDAYDEHPAATHGEEEEEEEDVVPPLPPISAGTKKQAARKSRSSRSAEDQEREKGKGKDANARPTRRSSRLSVASSRGDSSSPEPFASPVKRRSTRATVATPKKKAASKAR